MGRRTWATRSWARFALVISMALRKAAREKEVKSDGWSTRRVIDGLRGSQYGITAASLTRSPLPAARQRESRRRARRAHPDRHSNAADAQLTRERRPIGAGLGHERPSVGASSRSSGARVQRTSSSMNGGLADWRSALPGRLGRRHGPEPVTQDRLDDQPVSAGREPYSDPEVEFPARSEIDVEHREDQVLLLPGRIDVRDLPEITVVF